ncbi:hypothetical protein BS297_27370 [Rhodococcus erythropolis]|uniref:Solute-binding protein family 5 domain-containing protein n=1 Tax=Rhodococcus erythropolis TaxID=1833 RepID=A0A5N5DVT4_RHOER|nr:hypothetical protein BS297_27370 [Rhodococcus erythropolis]
MAIGLTLSACAGEGSSGTVASEPVSGGTIVFATDREPFSLDPAHGGDQPQANIARAYLDSLIRQESDGGFTPWLAKSWEISPDEAIYTFHLRDDVTFTDGTPFNAAAVKANFDHWLDPATVNSESSASFKNLRSIETPDDYTVVVDLGKPYADFLSTLTSSYSGMQSPAGLARGLEANDLAPIGTGPFIIESWDKQSQVTLVRNEAYNWAPATAAHQGPAYAQEIVWKFIPEATTRFAALESGEVDSIENPPPSNFRKIQSSDTLTLIDGQRTGVPVQLDLNTTRAPFDDLAVRQAFRHAVDVQSGLDSIYFGAYKGFGGSLSPNTVFYDPEFEAAYPFDVDKANQLLDGAGWTQRNSDGFRVKNGQVLTANVVLGLGATSQEYFLLDQLAGTVKQAGFDLEYKKLDDDQAAATRAKWDYDALKDYWGGPNTASALYYLFHSAMNADVGSGYHPNGTGYRNAELDSLIDQGIAVSDTDKRQALYSAAQKIISDEALNVPLYLQPLQYVYRNDIVEGVDTDPRTNQVSFYDAWVTRQ